MSTPGAGRDLAFGVDAPLHDVMRTMRAMRRLSHEPVDRDLLVELVRAATWAPSGSNEQAYAWVIVTDREAMLRVADVWCRAYAIYRDTVATVPRETLARDKAARMYAASDHQRDHFAETPALLVACYDLGAMRARLRARGPRLLRAATATSPRDWLSVARSARAFAQRSEAGSVYPGVQNLLLTARAMGLAANVTTTHLLLEDQFKRALGIPRRVRTFAAIPVGWPRGRFGPVTRHEPAEVTHWQRW